MLLLLSGCTPQTPPPPPVPATTLTPAPALTSTPLPLTQYRVAADEDVVTLDPALASGSLARWMCGELLFESLYRFDAGGRLQPQLAAQLPEVSTDGRVVTITLRADAQFQDGSAITADDVVFSLERVLDPQLGSWGADALLVIAGAERVSVGSTKRVTGLRAIDKRTLGMTLLTPRASLPALLTQSVYGIVPQKTVLNAGLNWGRSVVIGSGPYRLEKWIDGSQISFAKARIDNAVEGIQVSLNVVPVVGVDRIKTGEADFVSLASTDELLRQRGQLEGELREGPSSLLLHIAFNGNNVAVRDLRLRRAISSAINRDALARRLRYGVKAMDVLPPAVVGFKSRESRYGYDTNAARELMLDAQYPNGISRMLMLSDEPRDQIEVIQTDLRAIGIETEVINSGAPDVFERMQSGEIAFVLTTAQPLYLDPLPVIQHARAACLPAGGCVASIDALLVQLERSAYGSIERKQLAEEALSQTVVDEVFIIPLLWKNVFAIGRNVRTGDAFHPVYLLPSLLDVDNR